MEFRQTLQEMTRRQIDHVRHQTHSRLALSTLSAFSGGLLVLAGFGAFNIAPPILITLLLVITRMSGPAGQIQQGAQQLAYALPAYENVKELERDLVTARREQSAPTGIALPDGPIEFENVSFCHAAADDEAIRGVSAVSLTIQPGEFVGITGPSGAGKTTFADLLVGLFPPQQGQINIAGTTLAGETLTAWRDCISYISQDAFLFHDTIRRNLIWVHPQAAEPDMWQALAVAGAEELVRGMPLGLDTVVGERGTLVSGGERQRLALARAILRKPRLFVMDEATSAIDVAGERDILNRLRALAQRPTVVLIAHRAESLMLCERVLRFEGGRCVGEEAASRG